MKALDDKWPGQARSTYIGFRPRYYMEPRADEYATQLDKKYFDSAKIFIEKNPELIKDMPKEKQEEFERELAGFLFEYAGNILD